MTKKNTYMTKLDTFVTNPVLQDKNEIVVLEILSHIP